MLDKITVYFQNVFDGDGGAIHKICNYNFTYNKTHVIKTYSMLHLIVITEWEPLVEQQIIQGNVA